MSGIALTGSLFYHCFVTPTMQDRSLRGWIDYLFPREMYTSRSAIIDLKVWILNGLLFIPLFEACLIIFGLAAGIGFFDLFERWFGPGPTLVASVWAVVVVQFFGFWFGQGIGQYSGHLALHRVPVLYMTGGKLLPETAATIIWHNVAYVLIGFRSVDHLHIPVSYGEILNVLVGSPITHQVHHSAEERHRDVNMEGAGYLYDWLFGTLYVPAKGETWR